MSASSEDRPPPPSPFISRAYRRVERRRATCCTRFGHTNLFWIFFVPLPVVSRREGWSCRAQVCSVHVVLFVDSVRNRDGFVTSSEIFASDISRHDSNRTGFMLNSPPLLCLCPHRSSSKSNCLLFASSPARLSTADHFSVFKERSSDAGSQEQHESGKISAQENFCCVVVDDLQKN